MRVRVRVRERERERKRENPTLARQVGMTYEPSGEGKEKSREETGKRK